MKISVIIPFKNDEDLIFDVVRNLCEGIDPQKFEVIIVNDGSVHSSGKFKPLLIKEFPYPNVFVINNKHASGVGASFDRGVEASTGDIIVLMGADVFPRQGWYDKVRNEVLRNPNTLGGATCIGINSNRMNLDDERSFRRYGAELLFTVNKDDLPEYSPLREIRGGYTSLFKAKWMFAQMSREPYHIPCVLGAFYFTSRDYYRKLGGWDTQPGNRFRGHICWGHLEPYISLKSWLMGGGCTLYPDIEAGHVFSRITRKGIFTKGARSAEWQWWNACFINETQILDEGLRQRLYDSVLPELNFNVAKHMIKYNYNEIISVRKRNEGLFVNTPSIFTEKFKYRFRV